MNNQQYNPDIAAYLYQRAGEKGIPLGGNFELTPRCNMNCKMCYIRMSEQEMAHIGRERTVDEWLDIAKQAKDAGMLFLMLTGGEIDGAEDVKKSFPDFFERLSALGAEVKIIGD